MLSASVVLSVTIIHKNGKKADPARIRSVLVTPTHCPCKSRRLLRSLKGYVSPTCTLEFDLADPVY